VKELKSFILYLDANNLYGWAMLQYLPTGNFRCMKNEEELANLQKKIENNSIPDNAFKGYTFKVDLKYPHILHLQYTDYPLVLERMRVKKE
jgi:hypothetical protein